MLVLAGFWTFGVVLLVGSLYGSVASDQFQSAPTCSPGQVFAATYCRVTVDATVTALTSDQVGIDVGGRQSSIEANLHGPLPDDAVGLPVRVTFYRGTAVHIKGGDLNFDTEDAPVDRTDELRFAGLFILIGGTLLVGILALRRSARLANSP
ncbi:hypothetical protein Apa02nite_057540 [Actinoplanes palleronii]|uniref:DUF3592 domain-containing protein n=1 Tax=Actinoplanes palleronii TaxID=113570 RepID=A0ABQ4BG32_9ACTN|nr:hypothetical protein Apa02nite_057540 [Actinoplanes palleronii]